MSAAEVEAAAEALWSVDNDVLSWDNIGDPVRSMCRERARAALAAAAAARPASEDTREALARAIWHASRADEGTISATGANHVADAILAEFTVTRAGQPTEGVSVDWPLAADGPHPCEPPGGFGAGQPIDDRARHVLDDAFIAEFSRVREPTLDTDELDPAVVELRHRQDMLELASIIRRAAQIQPLGPNSRAVHEAGGTVMLTPAEAEAAARAVLTSGFLARTVQDALAHAAKHFAESAPGRISVGEVVRYLRDLVRLYGGRA